MTFMNSLAANPGGGIYGMPGQQSSSIDDPLALVNNLKDREMRDFKDKAAFMADLSERSQLRLRNLFGAQDKEQGTGDQGKNQQPNVVMGSDPNSLTGYQKGELGIRQQGLNLESQKLAQSGRLGEEAIGVKQAQEKLNQQKSDQINVQKQADMERKINEANAKIELAKKALEDKTANQEAQLAAHKAMAEAIEERHKLELAMKEHQFSITSEQHQKTIDALQEKLKQSGRTKQTTELNPDGTKKTITTEKGDAATTIKGTGRDGKQYDVPLDQIDDWNANHAAPGTEIKRPEGDQ